MISSFVMDQPDLRIPKLGGLHTDCTIAASPGHDNMYLYGESHDCNAIAAYYNRTVACLTDMCNIAQVLENFIRHTGGFTCKFQVSKVNGLAIEEG